MFQIQTAIKLTMWRKFLFLVVKSWSLWLKYTAYFI